MSHSSTDAASAEPTGSTESPYLAARRVWNDHVGRLVADRLLWQAIALLSLLVALACVGGLVHIAGQSRFVPYVVEVDAQGNAHAVRRADGMSTASQPMLEAQLDRFITLSRRVSADIAVQRQAIFEVYALLEADSAAAGKMTDHLNGDPLKTPFARAQNETVSTEVRSVLRQSAESWQIDWTETVFERTSGRRKDQFEMRALVQLRQAHVQHDSEESLRANPLGVYIRDYSWSRLHERRTP
jgi:type IV secretory pathway TrbF-like protein